MWFPVFKNVGELSTAKNYHPVSLLSVVSKVFKEVVNNRIVDYPMRAIVSTTGTPPYGISQYLVELIQPTLNKSKYKITNSSSFLNEAKDWLVKRDEVQVSYDIVSLYPSVPINKALNVLMDQLNSDKADLMKRTKLCLKDIYELAELCLNKCYFLWNGEIRILKNSGRMGLSLMVVLSESYVQNLEQKAIAEASTSSLYNIVLSSV